MNHALIVREPFTMNGKHYPKGHEISDPALAAKAAAHHPHHVIRMREIADPEPVEAPEAELREETDETEHPSEDHDA